MARPRNCIRITLSVALFMVSGLAFLLAAPSAAAPTPHGPVYAFTDSGLGVNSAVTGGNGTAGNPYIIEGWEINASTGHGIHLLNTNAHVIIRNLSIHSGGYQFSGIYLQNARNVRIENVTLRENDYGLLQYSGGPVRLANSTLIDNDDGVRVTSASYTQVNSTTIRGSFFSIWLNGTDYVNISNSDLHDNYYGIYSDDGDWNRIIGNRMWNNTFGLRLQNSRYAFVGGNTFTSEGLTLTGLNPSHFNSHTIPTGNMVNGKPLYYHSNCLGTSVEGIPVGQLIFAGCTNARAANLTITDTDYGLGVYYPSGGWVNDTTLSSNIHWGIDTYGGSGLSILRSTAEGDGDGGMMINRMTGALLRGNSVSSSYYGALVSNSANATLDSNNMSYDYNGVYLWASSTAVVTNNILWNDTNGLYHDGGGSGTVIASNVFSRNLYAAYVRYATNLIVRDNNASWNDEGIWVRDSPGATLLRNSLFSQRYSGVTVLDSNAPVMRDNRAVANGDGLVVTASRYSIMATNTVVGNAYRGIAYFNTRDATIDRNNASSNIHGIYLWNTNYDTLSNNTFYRNTGNGLYLGNSLINVIHHNSFLGNVIQAFDSGAPWNDWNLSYGGGGNYWSNYTGVDVCRGPSQTDCTGPDGLGDTSFNIGFGAYDYQPLMRAPSLPNSPPTASFTYSPTPVHTTSTVTLDATGSWDYEDDEATLQVRWDWNNDGTWDTNWSTTKVATRQYGQVGSYTVRLQVRDRSGLNSTTTRSISVTLPPVSVVLLLQGTTFPTSASVEFSANVTGGQGPYTYLWDFGDGSTSTEARPSHSYARASTYIIVLTVTDSQGQSSRVTSVVVVADATTPPGGGGGFPLPLSGAMLWVVLGAVIGVAALAIGLAVKRRRGPREPSSVPPKDDLGLGLPP